MGDWSQSAYIIIITMMIMIWLSKIKIYYLIIAVMIVFVIVIILTMMLMWISYFLGQKHLFTTIYTIKAIFFSVCYRYESHMSSLLNSWTQQSPKVRIQSLLNSSIHWSNPIQIDRCLRVYKVGISELNYDIA